MGKLYACLEKITLVLITLIWNKKLLKSIKPMHRVIPQFTRSLKIIVLYQ